MEKKTVSAMTLILLLTSMLTLAFNIQPAKTEPATIMVPDDYPTIQEAINAANPGDTMHVRAGTYYESIVVNKTVSLVGENPATTIIDGSQIGTVVSITQNSVNITGFTIRNSSSYSPYYAGIYLNNMNNCNISGNNITANNHGILLYSSSSNSISGNNITNSVSGIELEDSSNKNAIYENNITNNTMYGISLYQSDNNTIYGNSIKNNGVYLGPGWAPCGICISESVNNTIYHNNLVENIRQVYILFEPNLWDDGYPSCGNYWSDYTGADANGDGIGDTPYVIDPNNQDRYPLMNPWTMNPWTPTSVGAHATALPIDPIILSVLIATVIVIVIAVFLVRKKKKPTEAQGSET